MPAAIVAAVVRLEDQHYSIRMIIETCRSESRIIG
jgi:hypothetical protein